MISTMRTIMNIESLSTIGSLENFLQGNQSIAYSVLGDKTERYQFIRKTLVKFSYATCSKKHKGVINAFLRKISGYSRQQLTRLSRQHRQSGHIKWRPSRTNGFACKYTSKDISLLAKIDEQFKWPLTSSMRHLVNKQLRSSVNAPIEFMMKLTMRTFEKTK